MIKRRAGADTPTVVDWTDSAAIKKADASGKMINTLADRCREDKVRFLVNGTEVTSVDAAKVDTAGTPGLRVNHNLNLHVEGFAVRSDSGATPSTGRRRAAAAAARSADSPRRPRRPRPRRRHGPLLLRRRPLVRVARLRRRVLEDAAAAEPDVHRLRVATFLLLYGSFLALKPARLGELRRPADPDQRPADQAAGRTGPPPHRAGRRPRHRRRHRRGDDERVERPRALLAGRFRRRARRRRGHDRSDFRPAARRSISSRCRPGSSSAAG